MKLIFRTVCFHLCSILLFALLFYLERKSFSDGDNMKIVDCFLMSSAIQAGVGSSILTPVTTPGKIIIIVQQMCLILTHVFTVYFFVG